MLTFFGAFKIHLIALCICSQQLCCTPISVENNNEDDSVQNNRNLVCEWKGNIYSEFTMQYYAKNYYMTCLASVIACHQEVVHAEANYVQCPDDLQQRIDDHKQSSKAVSRRRSLSVAVSTAEQRWPGGVVCYNFNAKMPFSENYRELIIKAMKLVEKDTNVRYYPLSKIEEGFKYCASGVNYIDFRFLSVGRDCNSIIGVGKPGPQDVNFAARCFEEQKPKRESHGTVLHELLHGLGFMHEQKHTDRCIAIDWTSLPTSKWAEMKMEEGAIGSGYDTHSIMHYPPDDYFFCQFKWCSDTIKDNCVKKDLLPCNLNDTGNCVPFNPKICDKAATELIGQRARLSQGDIEALLLLYPTAAWYDTFVE